MPREKLCGLYIITNLCNGKQYVGQSSNIYARWNHHKSNLKRGTHAWRFVDDYNVMTDSDIAQSIAAENKGVV